LNFAQPSTIAGASNHTHSCSTLYRRSRTEAPLYDVSMPRRALPRLQCAQREDVALLAYLHLNSLMVSSPCATLPSTCLLFSGCSTRNQKRDRQAFSKPSKTEQPISSRCHIYTISSIKQHLCSSPLLSHSVVPPQCTWSGYKCLCAQMPPPRRLGDLFSL